MPSASFLAHRGLPFMNPMSEVAHDRAVAGLGLSDGARVLETGCGSGELLLRVLDVWPTASGLGIDLDADAIEAARLAAAARLPGRDVVFEARDAAGVEGHFDAVLNVASSHVHGGYPAALRALRGLVGVGGVVLLGEGYWAQPPSHDFLDALGGATADELPDLHGLRHTVAEAGFTIEQESVASEDDWTRYEEGLAANAEALDRDDAREYAARIRARRALPDGGTTLGFALLVLRAV